MIEYEKLFLSSITTKVRIGNEVLVDAIGKVTISINIKGNAKKIHDMLYVPKLEETFISWSTHGK